MIRNCFVCNAAHRDDHDLCLPCRFSGVERKARLKQAEEAGEEVELPAVQFVSDLQLWTPGPDDLPPRPFAERLAEFAHSNSVQDSQQSSDPRSSRFRSRMPFWMAAAIDFCRRPPKPMYLIRKLLNQIRTSVRG